VGKQQPSESWSNKEAIAMPRERVHRGQTFHSEGDCKSVVGPVMCKEGKGMRNFACQYYDVCLEKAAKSMWSGFTCKECGNYQEKEEEVS